MAFVEPLQGLFGTVDASTGSDNDPHTAATTAGTEAAATAAIQGTSAVSSELSQREAAAGRERRASGMYSDLTQVTKAARAQEGQGVWNITDEHGEVAEVEHVKCTQASREMHSMFARYTGSEAVTAVRSVSGLDGVESWCRFYASYNRITFGLVLRVPRQWYVLTVARDAIHLKHTIMQWEDEWNKNVVTELSSDTRVSDLWRMSALLETVPRKSGSRYCCGWTKSENTIRPSHSK